jgi:hypothetical protein
VLCCMLHALQVHQQGDQSSRAPLRDLIVRRRHCCNTLSHRPAPRSVCCVACCILHAGSPTGRSSELSAFLAPLWIAAAAATPTATPTTLSTLCLMSLALQVQQQGDNPSWAPLQTLFRHCRRRRHTYSQHHALHVAFDVSGIAGSPTGRSSEPSASSVPLLALLLLAPHLQPTPRSTCCI